MSPPPDETSVDTIEDLLRKYGVKTITLVVETFVRRAPEFEGDGELARRLGVMMADLESGLADAYRRLMPGSFAQPGRTCQVCNRRVGGSPRCRCL